MIAKCEIYILGQIRPALVVNVDVSKFEKIIVTVSAPHDANLVSRFGVRRQLRHSWTFTTDWRHARHTKKTADFHAHDGAVNGLI